MELGTTDPQAAKKFYASVFGWEGQDTPAGPGMVYTLLKQRGRDVGGCYQLTEEMHKGVPPHWLCYVATTDVDKSAAKAKELGATIALEPFDVMELGRLAMFQDPQGAMLAMWQAKTHIGAQVVGETNAMCWNELATTDPDAAAKFYSSLFGWEIKKNEGGPMPYTEFKNAGTEIGGMYKLTEQMKGVPPNWVAYWMVDDCDAIANKASAAGGTLVVPPMDIPHVGRFSTIQDPQGAVFAIIKLEPR
jgi:predicted enzyme related to lactoylglutathione lyase